MKEFLGFRNRPSTIDQRPSTVGGGRRMARFSLVGAIGIAVQLVALALLQRVGMDYLLATLFAVEAAILHNFVWHERYTWRDRVVVSVWDSFARLVRFHLTNGAISLAGNALLMRWLVGELHLPVIPANLIAITACWLLNFVLSDRVVFTRCES
jgi:putative flippase GtrA